MNSLPPTNQFEQTIDTSCGRFKTMCLAGITATTLFMAGAVVPEDAVTPNYEMASQSTDNLEDNIPKTIHAQMNKSAGESFDVVDVNLNTTISQQETNLEYLMDTEMNNDLMTAISNLSNKIDTINTQLSGKIDTINEKVTDIDKKLAVLETNMKRAQEDIKEIKENYATKKDLEIATGNLKIWGVNKITAVLIFSLSGAVAAIGSGINYFLTLINHR